MIYRFEQFELDLAAVELRADGKVVDLERQAECYRSLFRHLATDPWFHGMFLWRYYADRKGVGAWDYSPQGKPAEAVITAAWRRYAPPFK